MAMEKTAETAVPPSKVVSAIEAKRAVKQNLLNGETHRLFVEKTGETPVPPLKARFSTTATLAPS